ncbi:MAG TPA: hypothetical protein VHB48_13680, partial [Chitinophagaceae bacterium]|nr:hypothetical protein [Chitinophagaceae bacterium]
MKSLRAAIICITLCAFTAWRGNAQNVWPKSITADDGTLIKIYEPEPESFDGNTLKSKSVISILDKDSISPIFGTFWSISTVQADKVNKLVNIISV